MSLHIPLGANVEEYEAAGLGGGGFAIGSSYLIAQKVEQDGLTSGAPTDARWTLLDSAGSDVSINGVDDTKIDIATTGFYSILSTFDYGFDTAGPITQADYEVTVNGSVVLIFHNKAEHTNSAYASFPIVLPVILLSAGDYVQFRATVVSGADTWDFSYSFFGLPGDLRIYRLA